jgi:hypothetical protein
MSVTVLVTVPAKATATRLFPEAAKSTPNPAAAAAANAIPIL